MNLILIHGRDQQRKDPSKLKQEWVDTLNKGLKKSSLKLPDEVKIIFPYYGDLLDVLSTRIDAPDSLTGIIEKGAKSEKQLLFYFTMLNEISENAKIEHGEILQYVDGPKEKGPLNWSWVQALFRALDNHSCLGDISLKQFTLDVFLYLTNPAIKRRINEFVLSSIDPGPTVVVGHSLGSVVGYNVLHNLGGNNIKKYITVGSPLGLNSIKEHLKTPLKMPLSISNGWYNAYDERDFVALNPLDEINFNVSPSIINSNHVSNQTDNRHGIVGYLNDQDVSREIYNALIS